MTSTLCSVPGKTLAPRQRKRLPNASESILKYSVASMVTVTNTKLSHIDCKLLNCRDGDLFILTPSVFIMEPGLRWPPEWTLLKECHCMKNEKSISFNLPGNFRKTHSSKVIRETLSQDFVLQAINEIFLPGLFRRNLEYTIMPHVPHWQGIWDGIMQVVYPVRQPNSTRCA